MNNYHLLGGHSGCQIYLVEDADGQTFVRKVSKDKDYNSRLASQCKKQEAFFGYGEIKSPEVLDSGYTEEGLFFFDMEYIQGITLAKYIETMEIGKIRGLVETLVDGLVSPWIYSSAKEKEVCGTAVFAEKFKELRKKTSCQENEVISRALDMLEAHDWNRLIPSPCHGDMTLENIIIKNDQLYFIDFLDSFYDSWFLDIGTLLQDVQVMWSYRFRDEISMNTVLRLLVFRDILLDEIGKVHEGYIVEIYYSLLQKLIRIYPYVSDRDTYQFLDEKTALVIENIRELEARAGGVPV